MHTSRPAVLRSLYVLFFTWTVSACESPAKPSPASPPASPAVTAVGKPAAQAPVAPTTAPTPAPPTKAQTRSIPALQTACTTDADCAVIDNTLEGPEACCPGCTWHATNKTSSRAFTAACTESPAPQCPPIGCAMPIVEPKCVTGQCVAAVVK